MLYEIIKKQELPLISIITEERRLSKTKMETLSSQFPG